MGGGDWTVGGGGEVESGGGGAKAVKFGTPGVVQMVTLGSGTMSRT
jgi:hypothetical protein